MKLFIHKYVRRLIVWAQKLSDEEIAAIKRGQRYRSIPSAINNNYDFRSFHNLSQRDARELIDDFWRAGREAGIPDEKISSRVSQIATRYGIAANSEVSAA